jgi:ornithine cyclodeaminase
MSVPLITVAALRARVCFEDLIEPVSQAFQEFSGGLADADLITMFPAERPELGDVYVKTGNIKGHATYIVKVSPWFAVNVESGQPQGGFIAVFDAQTGHTRAILEEEHYLSAIRTAAAGSLAARALAPRTVRTAAVLGTGEQAFWQPQALYVERPFAKLLVWGRDREKAQQLVSRLQPRLPDVAIIVEADLEVVVRASDVVLTTTTAREPLVKGEWLRPGQHITAIGADDQTKCELDAECLRRADRLIVDSMESSRVHGDIARHLEQGSIQPEQVHGEIGSVLSGTLAGRRDDAEITIAKFVGLGVQDLAAAEVSLSKLALYP